MWSRFRCLWCFYFCILFIILLSLMYSRICHCILVLSSYFFNACSFSYHFILFPLQHTAPSTRTRTDPIPIFSTEPTPACAMVRVLTTSRVMIQNCTTVPIQIMWPDPIRKRFRGRERQGKRGEEEEEWWPEQTRELWGRLAELWYPWCSV